MLVMFLVTSSQLSLGLSLPALWTMSANEATTGRMLISQPVNNIGSRCGGLSPACQWGSQSTCRGRIRSAQMLAAMAAKRSSLHVSGLHTGSLSGTCTRRRCLLQCEQ